MTFSNARWRASATASAFSLLCFGQARSSSFTENSPNTALAHVTHFTPTAAISRLFSKDTTRFCFKTLGAREQADHYSRILSVGASFTHGCMGCDANVAEAQSNALTGDAYWLRRNFLVRFLTQAPWKNTEHRPEGFFALENDRASKPSGYVTQEQAAKYGYSGIWHFSPARDDVQLLSLPESKAFAQGTTLFNDFEKMGGIEPRFDLSVRTSARHGVAITAYSYENGSYVPLSKIFDVSIDGGRLQDVFRTQGGAPYLAALEASQWSDPDARERAIAAVAKQLASYRPSIVLAIDVLFWDSFVRTLSLIREQGTSSLVLRFLLSALERSNQASDLFDQERAQNIRTAFYEVMRRVSRGETTEHSAPVPILIAKLLDNAPDTFKEKQYEPVIAAILGEFASQITGKNLAAELLAWLRFETSDLALSAHAVNTPSLGPRLSAAERRRARKALEAFDRARPRDPTGRKEESQLPAFARPLVTALLMNVLKESGSLLQALGQAMNETNDALRQVAGDPTNNIHLVNADSFFEEFASYLKPETMHPSVSGARRMGELMVSALCEKKEPHP